MRPRRGGLLASFVLAAAGCGGPEVEAIAGRVCVDGKPRDEVTVCFWPKEDLHRGIFLCPRNNADGSFLIHPDPAHGQKGMTGKYAVIICDSEPMKAWAERLKDPSRPVIPVKYGRKDQSPLEVDIRQGTNELAPFELCGEAR